MFVHLFCFSNRIKTRLEQQASPAENQARNDSHPNGNQAGRANQGNQDPVYEELEDMSNASVYADVESPNSPEYDIPYAEAPSADPGGFVAIGCGIVTQYGRIDDYIGAGVVLETGTVTLYNTEEENMSLDYDLPGAIGNPSVEIYQEVPE